MLVVVDTRVVVVVLLVFKVAYSDQWLEVAFKPELAKVLGITP